MQEDKLEVEFTEAVLNSGKSWNTEKIARWWLSKRRTELSELLEKVDEMKGSQTTKYDEKTYYLGSFDEALSEISSLIKSLMK